MECTETEGSRSDGSPKVEGSFLTRVSNVGGWFILSDLGAPSFSPSGERMGPWFREGSIPRAHPLGKRRREGVGHRTRAVCRIWAGSYFCSIDSEGKRGTLISWA
jgi:hypothetical protein